MVSLAYAMLRLPQSGLSVCLRSRRAVASWRMRLGQDWAPVLEARLGLSATPFFVCSSASDYPLT